ncbi:GHKL domain-containing protein [Romboutsia sedimentorum]|uniref:sensor histidine kinase n=1 Tax=Romboutsia sedimentorum TaxID=1368474 RepID=UPI0024DE3CD7|nr:GHKL domain-containing protein [Romboutsia sedimentorum]MDK2587116.1 GHKL domain-containing protein [Romboutsia sedimentorum]
MKLMEVPDISQVSQNILFILYFITFMTFLLLVSIINNENRLKEINEYNNKLEKMTNEMKRFRHDYKNILLSMNGYIQENDMEGLRKLFYCSIEPLSKNINSYNLNITSISNIKNLELKGIVLAKLIKAEDLGIDINISTYGNIDNININIIDLCRVIGIMLDNCIEASLECNKPNIDICIEKKSNCTSFLISNTYINKIDNIADLFKQDISTKGANRGIGLSNLNEILDNYEDVCFSVKLDKYFIQKLDIYG